MQSLVCCIDQLNPQARLVIEDSGLGEEHVFRSLGYFDTEIEATHCSFDFGKEWIDSKRRGQTNAFSAGAEQ
jgi:hypothetical protein